MSDTKWNGEELHAHFDKQDVIDFTEDPNPTCLWKKVFITNQNGYGDGYKPGCFEIEWFEHGRDAMTYCPHCGKLIFEKKDDTY